MGQGDSAGRTSKAKAQIFALGRCNGMGERDPAGSYVKMSICYDAQPETFYEFLISEGAADVLSIDLRAAVNAPQPADPNQSTIDFGPYKPGRDKADHACHADCDCIRWPAAVPIGAI